jgi:hypothetical protein
MIKKNIQESEGSVRTSHSLHHDAEGRDPRSGEVVPLASLPSTEIFSRQMETYPEANFVKYPDAGGKDNYDPEAIHTKFDGPRIS